jgi:ribosome-binding factor A
MSRRTERFSELLLETLSELLLREVKDPRIGTVTLTRANVAPDLRQARVGYCTLGDAAGRAKAQKGLESAAKFMQGKVARLLRMRYAPEIHFEYDDAFEKADEVHRLLRSVRTDDESE